MAGGELDRFNPAGKHPAFIREDDLGRAAAIKRLGRERVVVYGVEYAVVATDRFDLYRPCLVTESRAIPRSNGLDRGEVISQPLGAFAQMVFSGRANRCPGTLHRVTRHLIRPSPVDAVGQLLRVSSVVQIPPGSDRRQAMEEIGGAGIIRVRELAAAGILGRNHGWFDLLGW